MMEVLKRKIGENKAAILRDLDLTRDLLAALTKYEVVNITDCVKLQQTEDKSARNCAFLDIIVGRNDDEAVYITLIECLQKCGQRNVAALFIDVREEMQILSQIQSNLDEQIKQMNDFLATEERRAGIYLTESPADDDNEKPALSETEVWSKVQESLKRSQQQLNRCQAVIQKLHQDCETVAKQNADIVEHTKECDAKIKAVLSYGRQSAKQKTVPKKTQDLFANLMDDIEKLVKTRRKVLDKETEGRRHSTRIVRQCRDWVESRCVTLKKLNNPSGQGVQRTLENGIGEAAVNVQRAAPPTNDNAILSILDSLQLFEKELQEYVHQEIILSDKFRTEMRKKHLQKKLHGFNIQGMTEIENALHNLEKNPESFQDNIAAIKCSVREINREYGECVSYLNKVDPNSDSASSESSSSSPKPARRDNKATARNWPGNFKRTANFGGNLTRSLDNNLHVAGRERTEPNQLLNRIKSLATKHEELKSEDLNLSSKYRTEISKRKRDMDIVLQKKDDQIMRLQTDIKEVTAEKDKYKKLYNDTKIGYQRNYENS
ncbi:uncharacterized protein LOC123524867 [Mercenaria mercenaria]|uniref:uncharacterized protein LOC123524867 n=1 Tax=Mercenaria mercenaria TaxID=6596 RepID=UPI00234F38E7|nr:uncharacterized protein LOC123524867 [Mercenaria mercenaria]